MYSDEDLIPISALQHYLFCPRQCALIHVDGLWAENRLTAEGAALHERVDTPGRRRARRHAGTFDPPVMDGAKAVRALPLLSRRYGLVGKADVVEFPASGEHPPRPVEHKRGRPKRIDADRVQLCAQAICLEEMLDVAIESGLLFYNAVRRREEVVFTNELRVLTVRTIEGVRGLIDRNEVPRAEREPKCRNCSLRDLCLPGGTGPTRSVSRYLARSIPPGSAEP